MLLALLAVEGVTILCIRQLLSVHVFVGLLLIPPVALKLSVTGYRFLRYYTRDVEYVRKGPPMLLMRMLVAPGLVVATFGVFGRCDALIIGPGRAGARLAQGELLVWGIAFALHVLVYALRVPRLVGADWDRATRTTGAALRVGILAVSAGPRVDDRDRRTAGGRALASRQGDEHDEHDD